ncbi:MAG: S8 family serine peptidase [Deltaproteobacteria bacterium]|nr:S8 family serine peptidase [Deltaproteobacteria bacterium]
MKYRPFIVIFICAILAISCGGNFSQSDVNGTIEPEDLPINLQVDNDNTNEQTHQRTNAPDYSGKVVIKFKDGTDVRLSSFDRLRTNGDDGPFMSLAGADVREINEILRSAQNDRVGGITRVMTASEEEVSRWQEYWRKRGVTLHDWNLYYYLEVPEYEDARELVDILSCHPCENRDPECANEIPACAGMTELIEYSEILPIFYLTSVTTPDMSDEQGYLKSADEGGLGIEDAWAKLDEQFPDIKLRGQNSMVVDQEFDWNFDHEILPIDETGEYMFDPAMVLWIKENPKWPGKDIPENIHHGTAVVGIIAGQGNGGDGGISGIASKTAMRVASISGTGGMGNLKLYGDGDGYTIGLIFTIEVQRKGATTTSSGCTIGDGIASPTITGCVPMEASKYLFDVIQTTTSVGAIIVEGAGNGSVDLDTDAAEPKDVEFSNFSDPANDSGAIMVGASMGASRQKAAWSNCGSRVDVFGWGAGVVTSGYGDKYCEEGANGKACTDPDNPTKYTGQFGGTSAATAQIAGIAALVQSYMRQLVFEAGYNGKVVYLDSKQMRTILKNSGQPAVYNQTPNDPNPNCNIGVQPDMAKAIEETNKFLNAGNILKVVPLNGNSDPNGGPGGGVVAGIRYDMDGDGRAELISFSRDHKWYIDLSSTKQGAVSGEQLANCEQSADGYCAWDVILSLPQAGEGSPEPNAMLFPVVHDYNSDGWADLALYDSINGKWYIKYSGQWLVASGQEEQMKWDKIIDYSADPAWKKYSRPVPGDWREREGGRLPFNSSTTSARSTKT